MWSTRFELNHCASIPLSDASSAKRQSPSRETCSAAEQARLNKPAKKQASTNVRNRLQFRIRNSVFISVLDLSYGALRKPSYRTTHWPLFGKPGACVSGPPSHPA